MRRIEIFAAALLFGSACSSPRSGPDERAGPAEETLPEVRVVSPERRDLRREIRLPGSIEAFEKVDLYAKAAGYLKRIVVDRGDRVREGQVLAELEIPEMVEEQAEVRARLTEAVTDAELKRLTHDRLSRVFEKEPEVISRQEVDEARADMERALAAVAVAEAGRARLQAMMDYSVIRAPFSGIVTERFVDPGALIQTAANTRQATPLVTVMNMTRVRVYAHVPEGEVTHVKKGTPAVLVVDALEGRRFDGPVTRITSALDPATRTMKVEIDIPNQDGALLHGMYGMVTLSLGDRLGAMTLPGASLMSDGGQSFVLSVENDVIVKRPVTTGMDDGEVVEILSGLEGDERLVIIIGDRSGLTEGMRVIIEGSGHE